MEICLEMSKIDFPKARWNAFSLLELKPQDENCYGYNKFEILQV